MSAEDAQYLIRDGWTKLAECSCHDVACCLRMSPGRPQLWQLLACLHRAKILGRHTWDRRFESPSLQRRVRREPEFLENGRKPVDAAGAPDLHHRSFFFNDTATTEIYTLSLHDALPI